MDPAEAHARNTFHPGGCPDLSRYRLTKERQAEVLAMPSGERPVLVWWLSSDGEVYAFDGIAARKMALGGVDASQE